MKSFLHRRFPEIITAIGLTIASTNHALAEANVDENTLGRGTGEPGKD
jgi:hypothetical protein